MTTSAFVWTSGVGSAVFGGGEQNGRPAVCRVLGLRQRRQVRGRWWASVGGGQTAPSTSRTEEATAVASDSDARVATKDAPVHAVDGWPVAASARAQRTVNPIRNLVQQVQLQPNPDKPLIHLSVGDPGATGYLQPPAYAVRAYAEALRSGKHHGYTLSTGAAAARAAVAARYAPPSPATRLTADDVFLTSGASGALELALSGLLNEGDNVLVPVPGFPLVRTIVESLGATVREYALDADRRWQVETRKLARLVDGRTRAIVVNNPSNPCGSTWTLKHMRSVVAQAYKLRLPILADEVYADMTFKNSRFVSFAAVSKDVPVIVVGGLSKQLAAPGWRLGWVQLHDRGDVLTRSGYRQGLYQLSTRMLIPNAVVQAALPVVIGDAPRHLRAVRALMRKLEPNAQLLMRELEQRAPAVQCIAPQGAMYLMARVDTTGMCGIDNTMDFCRELWREESVSVLPGECFGASGYIRLVFCVPPETLVEAAQRIGAFCARRARA